MPDEFEVVFVERGRLECESHFRAGRNTITRWLKEAGKARLLKKRSQFVAENRRMERARANGELGKAKTTAAKRKTRRKAPDPRILERAAAYLRMKPNGSWVVYEDKPGEWILGTMRVTAADVLDKAKGKGFDAAKAARQIRAFDVNGR
jgi:1-acyl-sn-glycerol-3-phosphate acyltransferase